MALLHNNKVKEVVELIQEARKNNYSCGMARLIGDEEKDGYSYILEYADSIR